MKARHELALVLLLVLLAMPPRLIGLDQLPPGLFHDEAYEGIDARRIVMGARPVFLAENYGREPLYAYVMAGLFSLTGPGVTGVRATSALFGLLLIPASYLWGRVFFGWRVGLTVGALSTASYWTLHESRLGMRPISLPLFLAVTSALVWLAARHGRWWAWPAAGLSLGLAQYTYLPARLFPTVVLAQIVVGLRARPAGSKQGWRTPLLGGVALMTFAAITVSPLWLYFKNHPEDVTARSSVVSIFASEEAEQDPAGAVVNNLVRNLAMFTWQGDDTVRHNLPNRPVFDSLIAAFLIYGLILTLLRARQPATLATLVWLTVMLLPGLLSDSAPHFLRSIGLLPALFALPSVGLLCAANFVDRGWQRLGLVPTRPGVVGAGVAVGVLLVSQLLTWRDYFLILPEQPGLAIAFDETRAALARVAGDPPPDTPLDLPTPGWSYATIRFLRRHAFDDVRPAQPASVRVANNAEFQGYDLDPPTPEPGRPAALTLYWRALREMPASYQVTTRVVDAYGRVWWEEKGAPGRGTLPTDTWLPGELVSDRREVVLDPGAPRGDYQLEIWWTQPDGERRLGLFDASGRSAGSVIRQSWPHLVGPAA